MRCRSRFYRRLALRPGGERLRTGSALIVRLLSTAALIGLCWVSAVAAEAQSPPLTQPAPMPPLTPTPQDRPFPGVIRLSVDATDVERRIFRVHETIPVTGGAPMTLLYPEWIPGDHEPSGPLEDMAGLVIHAGGQRVEWTRDVVNVYAFHVTPPAGATSLDLEFQYISPQTEAEGRVVATPAMAELEWNAVALYPAGYFARDIPIQAQLTLPEGWGYASALGSASQNTGAVDFKAVPFDVLLDSPVLAGRYFERVDLDPGAAVPVYLDVATDRPEQLVIKPEELAAHRNLVTQAYRLFGSHHYDHYDFLLSLSDELGDVGLEHHRSSEDGDDVSYFTDWDKTMPDRDLLAHEFTHSWNGKYRRPADLWTADYNTPMRDSLLWVYEGQTQYWGYVLSARSGLWTQQQALDRFARDAALYQAQTGREWKALQDTTNDPIVAMRRPEPWGSWRRSEDYYEEGALIWLEADTLIRQLSGGKRSLDDFARSFFGVNDGRYDELTYRFGDVVAALNAVQPYDWAGFLRTRLDGHGPGAPLGGVTQGGYRLVFTDKPSDFDAKSDTLEKRESFTFSLGLTLGEGAVLRDVLWDGPAFKAGLAVGDTVVAVNGMAYDEDRLKDAVTAAKGPGAPVELIIRSGERYRTVRIDYHDGLRYPHLEKVGTGAASFDAILAAKP